MSARESNGQFRVNEYHKSELQHGSERKQPASPYSRLGSGMEAADMCIRMRTAPTMQSLRIVSQKVQIGAKQPEWNLDSREKQMIDFGHVNTM